MYESIVVIIRGVKYIFSYNTYTLSPEELPEILNFDDDLYTWRDKLYTDYDSDIVEYKEMVIEEK